MNTTLNAIVQDSKIQPKLIAFDTKEELVEYIKNNPQTTYEGIKTETVVEISDFIRKNYGKFLFLGGAYLIGDKLRFVDLSGVDYSKNTKFLDGFEIPEIMREI